MGLGMEIYESLTYAMFALDIVDAGLDYGFVAELAKDPDTGRHAAWLCVCTTIALIMEVVIKIAIQKAKRAATKDEDVGNAVEEYFDLKTDVGRAGFICMCSVMELSIFFIEDASTLFVWWQTGLYLDNAEEASSLSKANLYITVTSAILAVVGLLYGVVRLMRAKDLGAAFLCRDGNDCVDAAVFNLVYTLPVVLVMGGMLFWAWFALTVILPGGSRGCLGGCQANRALVSSNAADAVAYQNFVSATDAGGATGAARRSTDGGAPLYDAVAAMMGRGADGFSDETKEVLSYLQSTLGGCDFDLQSKLGMCATTSTATSTAPALALALDTAAATPTTTATFPFDFGEAVLLDGSGSGSDVLAAAVGTHADDTPLNRAVVGVYVVGWIVTVFGTGFTIIVTFTEGC
eukprot:gene10226-14683_t